TVNPVIATPAKAGGSNPSYFGDVAKKLIAAPRFARLAMTVFGVWREGRLKPAALHRYRQPVAR
ncbi:MAG TPA: hypothetical protein PLO16_10605, partial [Acidocella sp.]|nr:hypothetical protein [Acidocella sp.]